jgi:hypothetical protein
MRKLLGLLICAGLVAALSLGSTGCTKKEEPKKPPVVAGSKDKKPPITDDGKPPVTDDGKKPGADDIKKPATDDAKKPATDDAKKPGADDSKKPATDDGKKAAAKEMTHEGTVVSATAKKLVMKAKGDAKEHEHTLAANAKVTCDGKDCKLEDLKSGLRVRVTTVGADMTTATRIEALDKNKEF